MMNCGLFVMYQVHILLLNLSAKHRQTLIYKLSRILRLLAVLFIEGGVRAEAFEEVELSQLGDMVF